MPFAVHFASKACGAASRFVCEHFIRWPPTAAYAAILLRCPVCALPTARLRCTPTAATRSAPFIRRRRRSPRSPDFHWRPHPYQLSWKPFCLASLVVNYWIKPLCINDFSDWLVVTCCSLRWVFCVGFSRSVTVLCRFLRLFNCISEDLTCPSYALLISVGIHP